LAVATLVAVVQEHLTAITHWVVLVVVVMVHQIVVAVMEL
jgi:hypothetical protein